MQNTFSRTELLLGEDNLNKLFKSRVAVFGLGGVGSYVAEALARAGVGSLELVDGDKVVPSNINRQLYALNSTLGMYKTEVAAARIKDINPQATITERRLFFGEETQGGFDFLGFDYVADAIDCISAKVLLAVRCQSAGTPIISSMGTGNKLNPMGFKVADIYKTSVCPLARVMRRELKKAGVQSLKVVYSEEEPIAVKSEERVCGTVPFVPSAAGLLIASQIIKDLISR